MERGLTTFTCLILMIRSASAHGGHLGELAGHSHWVGIAAVLGAVTLAALVARARKRASEEQTEEVDDESDETTEGASA